MKLVISVVITYRLTKRMMVIYIEESRVNVVNRFDVKFYDYTLIATNVVDVAVGLTIDEAIDKVIEMMSVTPHLNRALIKSIEVVCLDPKYEEYAVKLYDRILGFVESTRPRILPIKVDIYVPGTR